MGPLDGDLDGLWVADKSAAFLQKVNSLNTLHKVNNVRLISCPHSPFSPLGTSLEIKATAPGAGEWRHRMGLGRGLRPLGYILGRWGKSARPEPPRALSSPDWQIPNQTHPLRGWGRHPLIPQIQQVFSGRSTGGFLGQLEDVILNVTNKKPTEETLISCYSLLFIIQTLLCYPRAHPSFLAGGALFKLPEISRLPARVSDTILKLTL